MHGLGRVEEEAVGNALDRPVIDAVAEQYDRVRPGYPEALFDTIVALLPDDPRILEVGSGTGKATRSSGKSPLSSHSAASVAEVSAMPMPIRRKKPGAARWVTRRVRNVSGGWPT